MTLTVRQFPCLSRQLRLPHPRRGHRQDRLHRHARRRRDPARAGEPSAGGSTSSSTPTGTPTTPAATPRSRRPPAAMIVGPAEVTRIAPLDREVRGGDKVELGETRVPGHRDRRPHAGPHRLLRRRRPHRLRRRHPVRAGLRAAVRRHSRADVGLALAAGGAAGRHHASIAPTNTPPPTPASRSAVDDGAGAEGPRRARCSPPASAASRPCPPPSALEKATNPFLRAPLLADRVGKAGAPDYEAFAAVRAAKDAFKG